MLPLILILGIFTWIEHVRHRNAIFTNLSFLAAQTNRVIENSLIHDMLSRNPIRIENTLTTISQEEAIRMVYLLDTTGRVAFASETEAIGKQLDNRDPTCQPCHRLPPEERPGSVVVTLADGQRVFRSMNPIENRSECQSCHDDNQRLNGLLLTDILMAPLEQPLKNDLRGHIIWGIGTILMTVLVVNLILNRLVIQRLQRFAQSIVNFGRGDLDLPIPTGDPDEIGQLAMTFNPPMAQKLVHDYFEMEQGISDFEGLLSPRERQILKLLVEGYSNKEIASKLVISPSTVYTHRSNLMTKLGLNKRHELIQYARRKGLI